MCVLLECTWPNNFCWCFWAVVVAADSVLAQARPKGNHKCLTLTRNVLSVCMVCLHTAKMALTKYVPSLAYTFIHTLNGKFKWNGPNQNIYNACYFIWQAAIHSGHNPGWFTTVGNVLLLLPRVQQVLMSLCNMILTVNICKRHKWKQAFEDS